MTIARRSVFAFAAAMLPTWLWALRAGALMRNCPDCAFTDPRPLHPFLPEPRPERIAWVSFLHDSKHYPALAMGLQPVTHNFTGMKVTPHTAVWIEGGTQENPRQFRFNLTADTARALGTRLHDFADAADRLNQTKG